MRLICKILRTLLLTFVINGIFCDAWSIVTQRSQDFTINRQYLFIYIYFFNTVTLKATVNQCTLRAVRRHRYHPEFKQQLYTVPRYNYYSRLKYQTQKLYSWTRKCKKARIERESILDVHTHYKETETFEYLNFYSSHSPDTQKKDS